MDNTTVRLLKKNLKNPPLNLRPVQIIHHYFPGSQEEIDKYLDAAQKNEMGGFIINMHLNLARKENESNEEYNDREVDVYLGEGTPETDAKWESLVRFVDGCYKRNLCLWFYDELAFPSGAAGKRVFEENPDYQVKGLICATNTTENGEHFVVKDKGRMLYAAAYEISNEILKTDNAILPSKEDEEKVYFEIPDDGKIYRMCAFFVRPAEFYTVYNKPYVDLMRKEVTDCFIKHTHAKYLKYIGEERMKKVVGFFTDEPSLPVHGCQSYFFENNAITSWTEEMEGYVPNEQLVDVFFDTNRDFASIRVKWWTKIDELFSKNYFGRIGEWCDKYGTRMAGHLYGEETLSMQIGLNGSLFSPHRYMQAPGVDRLYCTDPRDVTAEKTASSAMHFYNRDMSMSENSFHLEGAFWNMNECINEENRLNSDYYQKQLGITNATSYFFIDSVTEESDSRKNYELKSGRASYFNSIGTHSTDVLVLIPMKEAYSRFVPPDHKYWPVGPCTVAPFQRQDIQNLEKSYGEVLLKLEDGLYDFDLVDDIALCECKIKGNKLSSDTETYNTLVIFDSDVYDENTKNQIIKFLNNGGNVSIVISDKTGDFTKKLKSEFDKQVTISKDENICENIPSAKILADVESDNHEGIRIKRTVTDDCILLFIHNRSEEDRNIKLNYKNFTVFDSDSNSYEADNNSLLTVKRKEILMCAVPV